MSLDANLIDLDDKIIYDISGGRHLWWMLPRVKGHRILITHDNNEGSDSYTEDKFKKLSYSKVSCDKLSEKLNINFDILPDDFYNIRVNLVDLAYGITFGREVMDYIPNDFKLEYGEDVECDTYWFKVSSVTELINCCSDLYDVCFSNYYPSNYGDDLKDNGFVESLKDFGRLCDCNLDIIED